MSKFLKDYYKSFEAYIPGEQPKDGEYIKLNTNESPFPPAPQVVSSISSEDVELLRLYSDPNLSVLKEKLAKLYDVQSENVFVSNGSDDILNFAFMAWGHGGAVFPGITYGFYPVFAQLHGIPFETIPLESDFTIDYKKFCGTGRMVVVANPNAPTGDARPLWEIEEIVKSNKENIVLVDEAYVDFGGESAIPLTKKYKNVLVVRTFSKSRCMAGARLGYAFADKELIDDLKKIKFSTNPYNINRLTAKLGEATVDAQEYYAQKCEEIIKIREYSKEKLETLGFDVLPSKANFLFAKCEKIDGEELYLKLKEKHILVRHFTTDKISQYNRITIGTKEQMDKLIDAIKSILSEGENI